MKQICVFCLLISGMLAGFSAHADDVYVSQSDTVVEPSVPTPEPYPFISINTDRALDMNWTAALEFTDPELRPVPIVLPFLSDYPIDNLEIKLRVLNLKF